MAEIICKISLLRLWEREHKIENGSWHKVDQSPNPQAKKNALIHHKNVFCASVSGLNSFKESRMLFLNICELQRVVKGQIIFNAFFLGQWPANMQFPRGFVFGFYGHIQHWIYYTSPAFEGVVFYLLWRAFFTVFSCVSKAFFAS